MLHEGQKKLLVGLITKPIRPLYLPPSYSSLKTTNSTKDHRELHFIDIVECALHNNTKSVVIIEILRLMQNEIDRKGGRIAQHSVDKANMTD